jgi:hypothetical protein
MLEITYDTPEIANEGLHNCVIAGVEDLGTCANTYRTQRRVKIVLDMLDQRDAEGRFIQVWMQYPFRLTPASKLKIFLDDIGCDIRPGDRLDLHSIIGRKIQIVVSHRTDPLTKRTYANIASVIKPRRRAQ